jgi:hypothetical protein
MVDAILTTAIFNIVFKICTFHDNVHQRVEEFQPNIIGATYLQ